ncbi:MAG: M15 family metallopeptidase [Erysipelotrichaceae bacterium]|nr:M15 family metallopeptidase [Erysipelotrichaceae bacterium]
MKYKHAVMMVVLTIISSFYKPNTPALPLILELYDTNTIQEIIKLDKQDIELLSKMRYIPYLSLYLQDSNFQLKKLARYIWWQNQYPYYDLYQIIIEVNQDKDLLLTKTYADFYQGAKPATNINTIDVLVNKQHYLPSEYQPTLHNDLQQGCYNAIQELLLVAKTNNYFFDVKSKYRSYDYQKWLYSYYQQISDDADRISCKPGFSEHQTGLVVDIAPQGKEINAIVDYEGYAWLAENAHSFGFILRYPENKDMITGIQYEPWHFRYVGKEIATVIYKNQWTLEEYHELCKDK